LCSGQLTVCAVDTAEAITTIAAPRTRDDERRAENDCGICPGVGGGIIIPAMRLIAALLTLFALGGQQTYPPPYPRPGTKALIDNQRAQVWDVSWPKGDPPGIHRHLYDMTGLYYWSGDRRITQADGTMRNITTKAGQIQW
jgi:hypothetical protein